MLFFYTFASKVLINHQGIKPQAWKGAGGTEQGKGRINALPWFSH